MSSTATATPPSPTRPPRPGLNTPSAGSDEDERHHRVRIGHLAESLGRHLGLTADAALLLRLAAPLHDTGAADASTPSLAPSAAEERRRGAALLGSSRLPLFVLAAEIALNHRERWDGNGYPQGLQGAAIPLPARIVAVVDHFDALTQRRRFRPARADDRALAMLAEQAGSAFDPAVVAAFLAHAPELIALRDRIDAAQPGGAA